MSQLTLTPTAAARASSPAAPAAVAGSRGAGHARSRRPRWMQRLLMLAPAPSLARLMVMLTLALATVLALLPTHALAQPSQGPGGPVLVITSTSSPFGSYYAEILRTEGLNAFAVEDIAAVTPARLGQADVVVLGKMSLNASQLTMFSDWVNAGGNLIAMAPDAQLAPLLGLTPTGATLSNAYLLVDTSAGPGYGIVGQTIQYHGTADRYLLSGASALATLYSSASLPTAHPAVTLHSVGAGKAAAFTYDLATSIVQTRQGNPLWASQERDGFAPIRSDDKFFGASAGDPQADWIDLNKVAIPQADEQQRLLANLILQMNQGKKPLPRFWYFPNGKKAVVIMTGDDHGNGGTIGRFDAFKAASPPGCSVANWECVRGTSYIFTNTPLSDAQAAAYDAEGFEVGLHLNTGCSDFDAISLQSNYAQQIPDWRAKYLSLPAPVTQRHHCIVWSDWATGAQVQLANGMRLDTSYYYWPPSWARNVPGLFTGSAMPMRFSALDGQLIDVYMAATQMTDESGQVYPFTVDTLLDRALGDEGYYGAYTVNAHTDVATITESTTVVASALARGVPIVTSRQMLNWLDARNASTFSAMSWNSGILSFTLTPGTGATGLQAMLPLRSGSNALSSLTRGGSPLSFTTSHVKGIDYAVFAADAGSHVATYLPDTSAPQVTSATPGGGSAGAATGSKVSITFSEPMDPASISAATIELRASGGAAVAASVAYNPSTRTAVLTPASALDPLATYEVTVRGGSSGASVKDAAGNPLAATVSWSFTTADNPAPPACPCGGWGTESAPGNASVNDPNAVELGVKFRVDLGGYITGLRFYKGAANTGTHTGNLWTANGQLLSSAVFVNETASGWQQVDFPAPVAVTANTVYVASYHAPNGSYAGDSFFFQAAGVDNGPVHLLQDGISGGNGVYAYGPSGSFPNASYQATNYWVDPVFSTAAPPDTTPPSVLVSVPGQGATAVATNTVVSATFSEPMDPATLSTATVELRDAGGTAVAATVSYDALSRTVSLIPASTLTPSTVYTATLRGGGSDPRVKDVAGNAMAASVSWAFTTQAAGAGCSAPANAIVAENCLAGEPASSWDVSGAGDASIQGFATSISVNRGSTVSFKVDTNAANYRFDIYRMGYYGGLGARKVATVLPSAALPQAQPACLNDSATGLIDCGNWGVSGSWAVPATAVSGIYFAKLVRADTGGASHIVFVVRDDASTADLLFQTSDTTWQAYNSYGGNSLYTGAPVGRAYKVSYNRPFNTRAVDGGQDWVFNAEYPTVRWLESNGYSVSYSTGVDTDRFGSLLRNHKVFLSVGHDEYWSGEQRANVEAARNAGVNLAFFSGNEIFWKTRWENSIDGSATPYRTLVSYKETHANAKIDPLATWTGTWRDPRFSPPADGGRPENALTGTLFTVNTGTTAITVPEAEGKLRLWRNTSIADLAPGTSATLPNGTLGYEWDSDVDNGFRPPGLLRLSNTVAPSVDVLQDYGSTYAYGPATHALTLYRHSSGARVFGAGTIQWAWGLDATHDRAGTPADVRMKQATVNLFADMGVQPASLQAGLVPATASTDGVAPVSAITSPLTGTTVQQGLAVTITGTASDSGGGVVGAVEVSTDGGATWHPATGRASWRYTWTPTTLGTATLRSRAVDDNGLIETPSAGITATVQPRTCPCTIWPESATPGIASNADTAAVNLGVKFRSDISGFITGIRFYKGALNTGTHVGTLWSLTGQQLASVTFNNETATGWQQANFSQPVAITAGTVYVASYFAPNGGYAGDNLYFASSGTDSAPLHALQEGVSGVNGVFAYAATTAFPTLGYQASNYWVDVVLAAPNRAPVLTPPAAQVSNRGAALSLPVAASDPDGDTLGFSATGLPAGLAINTTSGVISGTPTTNGSYTATVTVQDGRGGSATASLVWTVREPAVNLSQGRVAIQSSTDFSGSASRGVDGRTDGVYNNGSVTHTGFTAQPWWQVDLGNAATIDSVLLWNRTDCCTDRLQNFYVFVSATDMNGRTLDQLRTDANVITRQIGAINIAPSLNIAVNGAGRYVRVQLAGTQYLSLAEVQVFGVFLPAPNRPPVITTPATQTSTQGTAATLAMAASDPDSDPLTYSATALPTGLAINAATGVISGTPSVVGSYRPTVTVADGRGGSANTSFNWTVQAPNRPPVLTTPGAQTSVRSTALSLTVSASDPDANTLSFSATGLPAGLSINSATGVISGTPSTAASYTPTVTVSDGRGGTASGSFAWTITVPPVNLAQGRSTTQSSTYFTASSSRAVDGNTDGNYNNRSVSVTSLSSQPWWQVDLGQASSIDSVRIWNRTDCCTDRLQNFYVFVSASSMTGKTLDQLRADPNVISKQVGSGIISSNISIPMAALGRYVRVQLSSTFQYLNMAEVQVFGTTATTTGTGTGLQGQYFSTNSLSGNVVLTRTEGINFNWGTSSPSSSLPSDNFSVRWTGNVEAPATGAYQFQTNSDDGIRVWVNGQQIINNWTAHAATLDTSATLNLVANQRYTITVEYQEQGGSAVAQLLWRAPGATAFGVVPTIRLYRP